MSRDDVIDLTKERDYRVVKANELIQKTRHSLTLMEQKVLAYIISKIKPEDKELKIFVMEISEYCKISGIYMESGKNYQNVKDAIQGLSDRSFWLMKEDGSEVLCRWVSKVWISEYSGKMSIQLDDDLFKYLINLQQRFTQYELLNILPMKSQYSIRVYELLKSYSFTKTQTFELDDLKKKLMAETYKNYANFRIKVLEVATNEINKYTDLQVDFEPIKKGRKVVKVKFNIKTKSVVDQTIAKNRATRELDK